MESSRRDLLNNVAEHRSILKNNQTTYYPRLSFTPKSLNSLKQMFCFHCDNRGHINKELINLKCAVYLLILEKWKGKPGGKRKGWEGEGGPILDCVSEQSVSAGQITAHTNSAQLCQICLAFDFYVKHICKNYAHRVLSVSSCVMPGELSDDN